MRIIVVGGGIAGLLAAKKLGATLITDDEQFVFLPRLPELLCEHPPETSIPIRECHDDVIIGRASIDLENNQVSVDDQIHSYDELIIATGAQPAQPVPGVRTYTHSLYTHKDAKKLCDATGDKRVVIIGAGPTGVELAMQLADTNDVTLIQRSATILQTFNEKTRRYAQKKLIDAGVQLRLNQPVRRVTGKHVVTDQHEYRYDTAVWAAGVHANPPEGISTKTSIPINEYLRVQDTSNAWAIGDCAATGSPLTAQAAQEEAKHVVKNIRRKHKNKPLKPLTFKSKGDFLLLGDDAVMDSFVTLTGRLAHLIRHAYYDVQLRRYRL